MADSDKLYIDWELRGKLEDQIKSAIKDTEKLQEALEKAVDIDKNLDAGKLSKNIQKNAKEATEALYKLMEVREKAASAIGRNTAHRNDELWGFDDSRLQRGIAKLDEIINKVMNIGAEAGVSGNAIKNLLTTLDASIVMKDVKNGTKSLVSQMDKEEKERAKAAKESAKEARQAAKDEEDANARNAKAQEQIKDALAKIATARANLSAASKEASEQERMHAQLLMNLLDRLSGKLNALKGQFLGEKGALEGILGSGFQGLMRNVNTTINNIGKSVKLDQSDVNMGTSALDAAAQKMEELAKKIIKAKSDIEDTKTKIKELEDGEKNGRYFPKEKGLLNVRLKSQEEELSRYNAEMKSVSATVRELAEQLRFTNAEGQHLSETFGSGGAAAQRHAARQRELTETFEAHFKAEEKAAAEQAAYNEKLAQTQKLLDSLEKVRLDEQSKLTIAGIRGQRAEYDALSRKLVAIADLERKVANSRDLIKRGVNINPYTKDEITKELDRIQRVYNEDLARGKVVEEQAAAARRKLANASDTAAQATRGQTEAYHALLGSLKDVENAGKRTNKMLNDLTSTLGTYVSFYGLKRLLHDVVTIGGQFEVQHVALQNILGDIQEANILFSQIQGLAVESPKTFMELTSYAKQLSAYQIPANELYDTTKRLADMSSGLGVDMNRLILAYGQVRSAAVLRGQELRQFTEAGIPMVQALADKFTQMNGKLTTTADVFGLISKRAVPFEMVKEVLWDMTSQGGQFFNMQAELADTLYGKWQKLQDTWQIMLGSIADSKFGSFVKLMVEFTVALSQSANVLLPLISMIGVSRIGKMATDQIGTLVESQEERSLRNMRLAKEKQANILLRERITMGRELTAQEWELVRAKGRLTEQDYTILFNEGRLSERKMAQLALDGQINQKLAMRLALMKGYTKEQIRQMANGNLQMLQQSQMGLKDMWKQGGLMGVLSGGASSAISGIKSFLGGWPGVIMTAIGVAWSAYSYFNEKSEELSQKGDAMMNHAQKGANQLLSTIDAVSGGSDTTNKKIEVLENTLIEMGEEGKRIVLESRGLNDIGKRFDMLIEKAKAYQKALEGIGTPSGKALHEQALDDSDIEDEIKDYEDTRNLEYKQTARMANFSAKYQQMIDSMKSKYKELNNELSSTNLFENLRTLLSGKYANEVVGYFAGPAKNAIIDYYNSVRDTNDAFEDIRTSTIPKLMDSMRAMANEQGIDLTKPFERLSETEKETLRTIATNFASSLEGASEDTRSHIADWISKGFYAQLYLTPVVGKPIETGYADDLQKLQEKYGVNIWNSQQRKNASGDMVAFGKENGKNRQALREQKKDLEAIINGSLNKRGLEEAKSQLADVNAQLDAMAKLEAEGVPFISPKKKGGGSTNKDTALEALKNRIDLYKKFYSELENATKIYGSGALDYLKDNGFAEVFGWNLGDVTNYRQSLDELTKGFVLNTEARRKFANSVDADKVSNQRKADADAISKINSELKTQLSMLGEQYDTYKRIYQLTGNKEGAMNLAFGGSVQSATYKDELIRQMREALAAKPQGKMTAEDVFAMDKNTFAKTFGENSKIFSELYEAYAANEKKIKQETLQLLEETVSKNRTLAQQIDDENRRYERQLELIKQIKDPSLRQQAEQGATQEHDEKVAHLQFEQFKANTDWVKIFDDLDRVTTETLRDMMNATEQFGHTAGLSVEDVKALENAIAKIRNELANRNPFFAMSDALSRMRILNRAEKTHANGDIAGVELGNVLGVNPNTKVTKKQIKDGKRAAGSDFTKGVKGLKNKFDTLAGALDPVIKLFDELGMKEVGQIFGAAQGALGSAASGALGATALFGASAGPWGAAIGAGISILGSTIGALFGGHDEALEEEIKASKRRQKEMENLTKNLETVLEHTLGSLYVAKADDEIKYKMREYGGMYETRKAAENNLKNGNFKLSDLGNLLSGWYIQDRTYEAIKEAEQSQSYYDAQKAALMIQQDELRSQISSEEDKKDTDWDKIQDMNQQIKDLEMQIRYFAEEMAKDLYGIDYKSWAAGLADALTDAWASGENAVDAYKKKVSEMIKEVGTKVIAQKYLEPLLQKNMDEFMKYFEANDGRMDERGLAILAKMYDDADQAARVTSAFLDGVEQIANRHGDTIRDDSGSSASSSIKNITESTADLLASYINAIRADVSVNKATLMQLLTVVQGQSEMPVIARAQLVQLEQIARNTNKNANFAEDIYNLLHSLAPDGQGIKIK